MKNNMNNKCTGVQSPRTSTTDTETVKHNNCKQNINYSIMIEGGAQKYYSR